MLTILPAAGSYCYTVCSRDTKILRKASEKFSIIVKCGKAIAEPKELIRISGKA